MAAEWRFLYKQEEWTMYEQMKKNNVASANQLAKKCIRIYNESGKGVYMR